MGNSRGELWVVKNGVARGPGGAELKVPWAEDGVHYGAAVLKGSALYRADGTEVGVFNLVLIPYGLYSEGFVYPRYLVAVREEEALVVDTESWGVVERAVCRGKWDFMPAYPYADVKSLYCTDGFIIVVRPGEYGVYAAPCGSSYYTDVLEPNRGIVFDFYVGDEGLRILLKAVALDGRYLGSVELEFEGAKAVEPLSFKPLVLYVEEPGRRYVYWRGEAVEVGDAFFVARGGVVVGNRYGGRQLDCTPLYVHLDYYTCGDDVRPIV